MQTFGGSDLLPNHTEIHGRFTLARHLSLKHLDGLCREQGDQVPGLSFKRCRTQSKKRGPFWRGGAGGEQEGSRARTGAGPRIGGGEIRVQEGL
jgi:hypothetical protein